MRSVVVGLPTALLSPCGQSETGGATLRGSDWVLQRATISGACRVQTAPPLPGLGEVLATKPTAIAICREAAARDMTISATVRAATATPPGRSTPARPQASHSHKTRDTCRAGELRR